MFSREKKGTRYLLHLHINQVHFLVDEGSEVHVVSGTVDVDGVSRVVDVDGVAHKDGVLNGVHKPGMYGSGRVTRGTCFIARHLVVVTVAGLLWISWRDLGAAAIFSRLRPFFA